MLIDGTAILSMAVRRIAPMAWRLRSKSVLVISPDSTPSVPGAVYASSRQKEKIFRQSGFDIRLVSLHELSCGPTLPPNAFYILQHPIDKRLVVPLQRDDLIDLEVISNDVRFIGLPAVIEAVFRILESVDYRRKNIVVVGARGNVGAKIVHKLISEGVAVSTLDKGDDLSNVVGHEIVISAVGQPGLLTPNLLRGSRLVIDAGFWLDPATREAFGDAEKTCYCMDIAITPVPGGVGPLQVLTLLERAIGIVDLTIFSPWSIK